jgi:hypothetical protein
VDTKGGIDAGGMDLLPSAVAQDEDVFFLCLENSFKFVELLCEYSISVYREKPLSVAVLLASEGARQLQRG